MYLVFTFNLLQSCLILLLFSCELNCVVLFCCFFGFVIISFVFVRLFLFLGTCDEFVTSHLTAGTVCIYSKNSIIIIIIITIMVITMLDF